MKKFAWIMCLITILMGCSPQNTAGSAGDLPGNVSGAPVGVDEAEPTDSFRLRVTTNRKEKLVIPDPAETAGVAEVTLYQSNEELNLDNIKQSGRESFGSDNDPTVSLPFLGLEHEFFVANYAIGTIGEKEPGEIAVNYEYSEKKEKRIQAKNVKGNCLVLVLCNKQSDDDYDYEDRYVYLAVLDYARGTSHVIETGICEGQLEQLNLSDITGDGQDEMIVSGVANNWLVWQVFRLSDDTLDEITSDFYEDEKADSFNASNYIFEAFDAKFINSKKVKVWCKDKSVTFEKEIDVEDIVKETKAEGLDWKEAEVLDAEIEDYSIFQNINSKSGICYNLNVYVCHGSLCGKIKAYLKYNKTTDKLEITEVKFKKARD